MTPKRVAASVLWRSLNLVRTLKRPIARMSLRDYDPRLPHTIYVLRAMAVIRLLERFQPKSIVELGSGESSAWFASYASKRPGVSILSIDEWQEWQEKHTKVARAIGGVDFRIVDKVAEPPNGWRYDTELPDADFIFMDGPYHQTHEAGLDVALHLKRGFRPKVICVDGRTTGVDFLRTMTPEYDFHPQMIWCFERNQLSTAMAMREHSVFVRRL